MRKILMLLFTLMFACTMQAQNDVTTFLGIPVDGFKPQMREKLIAKGFTPVKGQDCLKGEFNGTDVILKIGTNNNKVFRIYLADENSLDEANIKIRYNNLVSQFEKNPRYITTSDFSLSESENISYEMICNKKRMTQFIFKNLKQKMEMLLKKSYGLEYVKTLENTI